MMGLLPLKTNKRGELGLWAESSADTGAAKGDHSEEEEEGRGGAIAYYKY